MIWPTAPCGSPGTARTEDLPVSLQQQQPSTNSYRGWSPNPISSHQSLESRAFWDMIASGLSMHSLQITCNWYCLYSQTSDDSQWGRSIQSDFQMVKCLSKKTLQHAGLIQTIPQLDPNYTSGCLWKWTDNLHKLYCLSHKKLIYKTCMLGTMVQAIQYLEEGWLPWSRKTILRHVWGWVHCCGLSGRYCGGWDICN